MMMDDVASANYFAREYKNCYAFGMTLELCPSEKPCSRVTQLVKIFATHLRANEALFLEKLALFSIKLRDSDLRL